MKIQIFVAHPDDEIIGMGGTILKLREQKNDVRIVYLSTGILSRRTLNYKNSSKYNNSVNKKLIKNQINELREDALRACNILKVKEISFYDYPDNEMDKISLLEIIKTVESEIESFKPDVIFTHHHNDLNIDHKIVYNAVITSCRPIRKYPKEIISFEVASSTEWNYPNKFNPNYFVEISLQLNKKIKAMEEYKNEIKKFPHPRSSENLRITAKKWGAVSGTMAAEAFEIIRKIER